MSLIAWVKGKGASGFGYDATADDVTEGLDLTGRHFLVTGSNSGIGLDSVRTLAKRGATVIAAARTLEKAQAVVDALPGSHHPVACELSEPESVQQCVNAIKALGVGLDAILCNAGIMMLPKLEQRFGVEMQLFTNHVGHFILVTGLLDALTPTGRVVMTSSTAHFQTYSGGIRLDDLSGEGKYSPMGAYAQSKLANLLFARHLATRLPEGQQAHAVHPGVVVTNLTRHFPKLIDGAYARFGTWVGAKTSPQGAATQVYVATHPDAAAHNGEYWADCNLARSSRYAQDAELAERLWVATEQIVQGLPGLA